MKILYITNGAGYGGSSIALEKIIQCLGDRIECQVVFPRKEGDFGRKLKRMGIVCHHMRYTMFIYPSHTEPWYRRLFALPYTLAANALAVHKIKRIANHFKPDIIHTNNGPIDLGFRVAKSLGIPHVWHLREFIDRDFQMRLIPSWDVYTRKFLSPHTYCIAITKSVFEHFHLRPCDLQIYDGVIPEDPHTPMTPQNYILFTGRLQEAKGIGVLLKAFAKYVERGGKYNLWIAGDGESEVVSAINHFISDHKLSSRVRILGFRSDVYALMSQARALIVPSTFEGFGYITAEAMYNHCLVIGRNTAGTKEQFDNGLQFSGREIGLRFEDDDQLPSLLLSVEQGDFTGMKDAAYTTVRSLYTIRQNAESIYTYYTQILNTQS